MRIAVLDDEPFFRHLLARSLVGSADIKQVDEYGTAAELIEALPTTQPDAAILDLVLAEGQPLNSPDGGLAAGMKVRELVPGCGIVILSNHASADVLARLPEEQLGGWAYLLKRRTDDIADVVRALDVTRAGETMIDPAIIVEAGRTTAGHDHLSAHQLRVLELLAGGASNATIADACNTTTKSIEHAITGILSALQIDARDQTTNARVLAATAYIRLIGATS